MKKIILGIVGIALTITLAACGTSANTAAINSLAVQLDETSNTISSVQSVSPMDINIGSNAAEKLVSNAAMAQQSLYGEENYKHEILARTAILKNCLNRDVNLSKTQTNAVKELTNNLNKYTNSVAYTKNELSGTVKSLSNLKKNPEKNVDKINAKLNKLACNSNTRATYYENILNTLNELEDYLCCENCMQNQNSNSTNEQLIKQNESDVQATDQNLEQDEIQDGTQDEENKNPEDNYQISQPRTFERLPYGVPTTYPAYRRRAIYGIYNGGMYGGMYGNGFNNFNSFYGNGMYGNGLYNGIYNGYNGMYGNNFVGINGGINGIYNNTPYNYNVRYFRFNPYRNTDTYAPIISNIDTYRAPTNQNENATLVNNPEERLENYEEIVDGEVRNIDDSQKENNLDITINQDMSTQDNEDLDSNFMVDPEQDSDANEQNDSTESTQPRQDSVSILIVGDSRKTFKELKEQILQGRSNNNISISTMARKSDKHIVAH